MSDASSLIDVDADPVPAALHLARRFVAGDRLIVSAPDRVDHAHHVAVEFVHPVVAGARPLPALVDETLIARAPRRDEVGLLIEAPELEGTDKRPDRADVDLFIPAHVAEAAVVRTYHVLWELVHVCLEHPGLTGGDSTAGGDSTGFLYPFLEATESDLAGVVDSLHASVAAKRNESEALATTTLAANADALRDAADRIRAATTADRKVLIAGNGGSACDAARLGRLLIDRSVTAVPLAANPAILSALANDLGAENMFSRQVEALGAAGDIIICLSTSGGSPNLLNACETAHRRGLDSIGIAGYRGGPLAAAGGAECCIAIDSSSVHRIQEAQAVVIDAICDYLTSRERAA